MGNGAINGPLQHQQDDEHEGAANRSHQEGVEGPGFGDFGHFGLVVVLIGGELRTGRDQLRHFLPAAARLNVQRGGTNAVLLADLNAAGQRFHAHIRQFIDTGGEAGLVQQHRYRFQLGLAAGQRTEHRLVMRQILLIVR